MMMRVVNIRQIKLGDIEKFGTVSLGQSIQKGVYISTHRNQGFGQNNADSTRLRTFNQVYDQDGLDAITHRKG